jgi:hypothetical protein
MQLLSSSSKSKSFVNAIMIQISSHSWCLRANDDNVVECDFSLSFLNVVECDSSFFLFNVVECDSRLFFCESQKSRVSFVVRVFLSIRDAIANSNLMTNEERLRVIIQHHMILKRLYMIENRVTKRRIERIETKKK